MKRIAKSPFMWIGLVVLTAFALWPLATKNPTLREEIFLILMFITMALSLDIILGFTGYVNFGHIVFFGLGGYMGIYVMSKLHWGIFPAMLIGGISASLLAFLLGLVILRLRGAYFALATIGINEMMLAFVANFQPFGAGTGMVLNFRIYKMYGGPGKALWMAYTLLVAVTLIAFIAVFAIEKSKFGLGLMVIREDEDAAMVMGIPTPTFKNLAYTASAFLPGVLGVLYFFKNGNIEPGEAFNLEMSIEVLVMIMLGGFGTVSGPIIGAALYEEIRSYLIVNPLLQSMHLVIAGLLLLAIILFVPVGVVGWVRQRIPSVRRYLE